ncbi:MAG: hypothetical protein WCT05_12445, partial [Lentisphaeria bacterium]
MNAEFTMHWDDAPLDISWIFADEKPAGKHGFLKVKNANFEFEDGTPARFWGTLINSSACFPPYEVAEKTARRLAKFGVNIVRLHQFDAEWSTPNIFQFAKGRPLDHTLDFDPESMDRFDYLIKCLKDQGIYIYMDLLVYRTFKTGDKVDNPEELTPNGAKPYSNFDPKLIELQKQYCQQLLTHVNPYTGLASMDDPAMAMVLITNENDMFNSAFPVNIEPYRSRLEQLFREWKKDPQAQISFDFRKDLPSEEVLRFYHGLQKSYLQKMFDYLRSLGVKVPIAGDSWSRGLTLVSTLEEMDFTCSNVYWDLWGDQGHNKPLTSERKQVFGMVPAKVRTSHQPHFITEWDMVWPHEWRSMSALLVSSMAAFQGWSGATIHTYRYRSFPADRMGGTILGGIPYRQNFETFMDPAKFGMFYAAAILYRRGDVSAAKETITVALSEKDLFNPVHGMANHNLPNINAMTYVEQHRLEIKLPGKAGKPGLSIGPDEEAPDTGSVLSDTGELYRNWKDGYGWIKTPRSKAVYGFFDLAHVIDLDGLKIHVKTDFATLVLTSLTKDSIENSRQILLTACGRSDNTDAVYNKNHTERISIGKTPVLYEVIEAELTMRTTEKALKVWSIDPDGAY